MKYQRERDKPIDPNTSRNATTGKFEPFHLYSMRQAIDEGFIHDVLANYVTYDTYFKIDKAITDDPELDKSRASAAIARFVSLHEHNLAQRAEVIINHFRGHVASKIGGQAKAMVMTASRLHALRYKRALDKYCREHGMGSSSSCTPCPPTQVPGVMNMPRSIRAILGHAERLAKRFEDYNPEAGDERPVEEYLLQRAALARARSERQIVDAVTAAWAKSISWQRIGDLLGTSAQAAQQRYGHMIETA